MTTEHDTDNRPEEREDREAARPVRLATVWLDGCSGCHMSFLDLDEALIGLLGKVELVYGPLVDIKEFPENVDVTLVEGAVSSDEDEARLRKIRANTKLLVSLGDCAVNSNVPSMRNRFSADEIMSSVYGEADAGSPGNPDNVGLRLLSRARPLHEFVNVDIYVQGCPPSAELISQVISSLLAGEMPDLSGTTQFG